MTHKAPLESIFFCARSHRRTLTMSTHECSNSPQIAKWLGAPVVLVIDCWAMARSVAALVQGYSSFDQDLNLAGLLLNKVGGAAHGTWLREALAAAAVQTAAVLGCIPKVIEVYKLQ